MGASLTSKFLRRFPRYARGLVAKEGVRLGNGSKGLNANGPAVLTKQIYLPAPAVER